MQNLFSILSKPELYLDPGSGSMLIQLILGAVLGLGVLVRVFWKNIKDFFTGGKGKAEEAADPTDPTAVTEDPTRILAEVDDTPADSKQ